jgi:hypothetical protein
MIDNYLNKIYMVEEYKKNPSYKKETKQDKYLKYGVVTFFGGWPGVAAYYLWRRRIEVKKDFANTTSKEKREKLKILFKELTEKIMKEKRKFQQKLKKKKKNENK